jgi:hypothetical protein
MASDSAAVSKANYDVAVSSNYTWLPFSRGMVVPRNAVQVGFTAAGKPAYACHHNPTTSTIPGNVEDGFCFLASGGSSFRYVNYELLTE